MPPTPLPQWWPRNYGLRHLPNIDEAAVFKREIKFRSAFDKRHSDPSKNYGVHGVEIAFYLHGPEGVVQFIIYTNWHLPNVQEEFDSKHPSSEYPYLFHKPMAADLGYHSRKPMYEDQEPLTEDCDFLGGKCYYDGSTTNAEDVFKILLAGGDEAVWKELERCYARMFSAESITA
jgi:hypothetical protein